MEIRFWKLEAAGNDFVGLDARDAASLPGGPSTELIRALCDRHRGIGADGVLLLGPPPGGKAHVDFTMTYYNADGSEGEMCGNGARAMAVFAGRLAAAGSAMAFRTGAGDYSAEVFPGGARVAFPPVEGSPREIRPRTSLPVPGPVLFLTVGVPHAVLFVEDLGAVDVAALGRTLRHDEAFAPAGTNVNFVQERGGELRVRTYERGVEAETLACGTGSVASAACWLHRHGRTGPVVVPVRPTGGDLLRISLERADGGGHFRGILLEGPARVVFEGVIPWNGGRGA